MIKKLFLGFIILGIASWLYAQIDWQYCTWKIVRDGYLAYQKDVTDIGLDTAWFNNVYAHRFRGSADSLEHLAARQFLRSDIPDTGKHLLLDSLTTTGDIRIKGLDLFFGTKACINNIFTDGMNFYQPGIASTMHFVFSADSIHTKNRTQDALVLIYGKGMGTADSNCLFLSHDGDNGYITTREGDLKLEAASGATKIGKFLKGTSYLRNTITFEANTTRKAKAIIGLTNAFYCVAGFRGDTTSAASSATSGVEARAKTDSLILTILVADTAVARSRGVDYIIMQ